MSKYIIEGGQKLTGAIKLSGNKNSSFPCIAAALLTGEKVRLENVPKIRDVQVMVDILKELGVQIAFEQDVLIIDAFYINSKKLPENLTTKLRGSVVLAGALLSRLGVVDFYHPGGDVIGKRAINLHLEGFEKLGYKIVYKDKKYSISKSRQQKDVSIYLDIPTVTGTENLILASVLRKGKTILKNCAQEPHVKDLCNMLSLMGADIKGGGTSQIEIDGVEILKGCQFKISSDYLEFGTYSIAAAITGGSVEIENIYNFDTQPIVYHLEKMGIKFKLLSDKAVVGANKLLAIPQLIASPWPGFPTDLMSVAVVLATKAHGVSLLHDWLYESRMFFVDKLINMNAHITIADPHRVVVYGPNLLLGRESESPDIRAGMALVLAALVAQGTSVINKAELIERGYADVVKKLALLGAKIQKSE